MFQATIFQSGITYVNLCKNQFAADKQDTFTLISAAFNKNYTHL